MRNPHQPGTGPTRTGSILAGRFQPYKPSRARANEYRNAGVGPSTLVPPPVPYVGSSMLQPSGGISETTADADENKTTTEEDKAPVSNFYRSHIPHVTERSDAERPPSGLGSLTAKDHLASTACGCRRMRESYAPGCRSERGSKNLRASTGL